MEMNPRAQSECIEPLKSLQELYQWTAREDHAHKTVPLATLTTDSIPGHSVTRYDLVHVAECRNHANAPKTIVCHDLKGGYLDDK